MTNPSCTPSMALYSAKPVDFRLYHGTTGHGGEQQCERNALPRVMAKTTRSSGFKSESGRAWVRFSCNVNMTWVVRNRNRTLAWGHLYLCPCQLTLEIKLDRTLTRFFVDVRRTDHSVRAGFKDTFLLG